MKWNHGCFDSAFLHGTTLETLQFTISKEHSLKPQYILLLWDELKKKGFVATTILHVGVTEESDFKFQLDPMGTGRQSSLTEDEPLFTIKAYRSESLGLTKVVPLVDFQADLPTRRVQEIKMWERRRNA
jgi:hypothetical protein